MKFALCIPVYGDCSQRLSYLFESIERYTKGFDYKIYVRDDHTENLEHSAFAELVTNKAGGTFLRGEEWGFFWKNFHELGWYAVNDGCDVVVFINDDCLVSKSWLTPIAYFYEWNEKLKPGIVSPVFIEGWELAMNDIISHEYKLYADNPRDWSNDGELLREHLTFSQELFDAHRGDPETETIHITTYHPMGPIVDGKFVLDRPVPLSGGCGPCFSISAQAWRDVNGMEKCEFIGDYEAMIGFKVWDAGYVCCMIPGPPIYHARGIATAHSVGGGGFPGDHDRELWVAHKPWTHEAGQRWKELWPGTGYFQDAVKHYEKEYQNAATYPLIESRYLKLQSNRFPINIEYDKLSDINQGLINWRDPRQAARMQWIAEQCRGHILDIGCATGGLLDFIRPDDDTVDSYTGVDFDRNRIDDALRLWSEKAPVKPVTFYVLDAAYGLPFTWEDGFSTTVCADILEHMPCDRARNLLNDIVRITIRRIIITLPIGEEVVKNSDHIWRPEVGTIQTLLQDFEPDWNTRTTLTDDFALIVMRNQEDD